jgi:hypothetical protein
MTNLRRCLPLLLCACLPPALALAQHEPGVMQYYDFENDTKPWVSFNPKAQFGLTAQQENVFAGTSSLEVKYVAVNTGTTQADLVPGNIILPTPGGLPGLQSVTLAFKCSESVPVVVYGVEQNGPNCYAPFFAPAGVWQQVTLGLADFYSEDGGAGAGAPFNPAALNDLVVMDASRMLYNGLGAGKLPIAAPNVGPRTFWLDEVKLLSTPLPPATLTPPVPDAVVLDSCGGAAIRWIVLGGRDWKAARATDPGAPAGHFRFDYTAPAGTLVLWIKPVHLGQLLGTTALHLSVRSPRATRLVIGAQENNVRYSAPVDVPAGDWKALTLPWSDFQLDKDSTDPAGKLQPDQITSVSLADPSAMAGPPQDQQNTLCLSNLYAGK